jgi:hypothetical protein
MMYDYDSDNSDYWDDTINEEELPEIDSDFRKRVLDTKHSLYKNIVFSGQDGTENAQNNNLINTYLKNINNVYIIAIKTQNPNNTENPDLSIFPEQSREPIRLTLEWIKKYFSENSIPDTIPYKDYIQKSFHEYPYVQTDTFDRINNIE